MPAATGHGLRVTRFPIVDGDLPADRPAFGRLVGEIAGWAAAGEHVVVHCKGGLGRAGTVGGCLLRLAGLAAEAALAALDQARPGAPENDRQRDFVRAFHGAPPSKRSRVLGAVLGAAIGDAMGHPTEFIRTFAEIRRTFPPNGVRGYEKWWERDGRRFAPYTDDTQMAEIVLRALVDGRAAGHDLDATMRAMAAGFVHWERDPQGGHRAPGGACVSGARALARGVPWREAGGPTAGGCGSVMRAYPFGVIFADDRHVPRPGPWTTHASRTTTPSPWRRARRWRRAWCRRWPGRRSRTRARRWSRPRRRQDARTSAMIAQAVREARTGVEPEVTLSRLEGWAAHEAIAGAAYVVARHPGDPRAAILEAANTPGDSDSLATLAGALTGAQAGLERIPADWVRDVERGQELQALAQRAADALGA